MKKFAAILASLVLACGMATAAYAETLTMCTNLAFPPYEFWDGDVQAGIDVEIAHAVAEKMGYDLVIEDIAFSSCIPGVSEGKYNFCMGGVTVTEERKQYVDFSDTYAQGIQVIIVPEGSPITSVDDLLADGAEYVVGCQEATTGYIYIDGDYEAAGKADDLVQVYKNGNDAVLALTSGKCDCVIIDNEPAKAFVAANPGLVILEATYVVEDYAAVLPKGNDEFNAAFNAALAELKEEGVLDAIVAKYINTGDAE